MHYLKNVFGQMMGRFVRSLYRWLTARRTVLWQAPEKPHIRRP